MPCVLRAAGLLAGACSVLLAGESAAQTSPVQGTNQPAAYSPTSLAPDDPFSIPRTSAGQPDFQGVVWRANFFTYLQSGASPHLTLPEDKAAEVFNRIFAAFENAPTFKIELPLDPVDGFPIVRGERRTRLLVLPADGKMPFTAEARKELAVPMAMAQKADNPEERSALERCITQNEPPPRATLLALGPLEFIQTPDHVVIHLEYGDDAHIIPFATAHRPDAPQTAWGNSIARWDGDTLVIETIGVPEWGRRRMLPAFIVNSDAKVIERYTRVSEDELLYQFTVEDPKAYSAPWLAEYSFHRAPYRLYPFSCHEANYSMSNILRGQRMVDERARSAIAGD